MNKLTGKSNKGFTLIEMMTTIAVVSVLTAVAVPSMQATMKNRQIEGAASEVYSNLLLMRSQALEKNRSTFVNFSGSGSSWAYGLDDEASCDPSLANDCKVNDTARSYASSGWKNVSMTQNFSGNTLSFEPRRGMALASGTIQLTSDAGQINVTVSPLGTVSICSAGTRRLGGYDSCS